MSNEVVRVDPERERALDQWVVLQLLNRAGGKDPTTRRNLHDEIRRYADDLAGPNPSAVERALADSAALSWAAHRVFEATYYNAINTTTGMSLHQSEHAQRRLDRLHRRLIATLRTLAAVRRIPGPTIQLNVARQSVNVAGAGQPAQLPIPD